MIYALLLMVAIAAILLGAMLWEVSGQLPRGERLARCQRSPQWHDGQFRNQHITPQFTGDEGMLKVLWQFVFDRPQSLSPTVPVPSVKSALDLPRDREVCVWLGHSTLLIQTGGVRYLFDPVLTSRLPVTLFMRPFAGADAYAPDDIPDVDYLIITHDHWDHLDCATVKQLRHRVGQVVCPLGVGQHLEYWGYTPDVIHDMDWGDSLVVNGTTRLRCLPSRHFSGRLLGRNQTLWASYLIDGARRIYVSGDGGYDDRFATIGQQYPGIDLAVLENGQYDPRWANIHTMPAQLPQAIGELGARRVLTYHHGKYALARHSWRDPLDSIAAHAQGKSWQLLTPRIGQVLDLADETPTDAWWQAM